MRRSMVSNSKRWAKTLFFLVAMTASLLFSSAPPLLVAILDLLLPSVLHLTTHTTPLDVPLLSAARSLLILCAYGVCDGRGPYLWITIVCSVLSVGYVSLKAAYVFGVGSKQWSGDDNRAVLVGALLLSSLALGMAHILAAYRTSSRERRKLLVYRIDIEAIRLNGGLSLMTKNCCGISQYATERTSYIDNQTGC